MFVAFAASRPARQSALKYPAVVSNRPALRRVQPDPPLMYEQLHRRPVCWIASSPITHLIHGSQIPIVHAAPPTCPLPRFPPWRFADAGPAVRRTTVMGPASEN